MLTRGKSIYTLLLTMLALTFMMSGCRGVKKFVRDDERILYQNYYEITTTDGAEPGKEIYDALIVSPIPTTPTSSTATYAAKGKSPSYTMSTQLAKPATSSLACYTRKAVSTRL